MLMLALGFALGAGVGLALLWWAMLEMGPKL